MILLKNILHSHHRCQHLLSLCRTKIYTLVFILLKLLAIDQSTYLNVVTDYQRLIMPKS